MKNDYSNGGMKVTDVESLDRALKLKQFIRASKSNHSISDIQSYECSTLYCLQQEYHKISEDEPICLSAQNTLNIIIDHNRQEYEKCQVENLESDKNLIKEIASINLVTYLKRKKKIFHLCMMNEITKSGIETLGELVQAVEFERNNNMEKAMNLIISTFPTFLKNISKLYNDDINTNSQHLKYMMLANGLRMNIYEVTTKDLQQTLKLALKKIEKQDFLTKLKINDFDETHINLFRKSCQNSKLRNIYFRLISNDFYSKEKMLRFKMTTNDNCMRCGEVETTKHMLYECNQTREIWRLYNEIMLIHAQGNSQVLHYEDIYRVSSSDASNIIKIKIIQSLIQIERPKNWTTDNIYKITREIMNIEKYNSIKGKKFPKFEKKWNNFMEII
jgi:hypothetical protein